MLALLSLVLAVTPCRPAEKVKLSLKEGAALPAVAQWATGAFCTPFTLDAKVDAKAKLTVGLSGTVSSWDARKLLEAALRAQALVLKEDGTGVVIAPAGGDDSSCERAVRGIRETAELERVVTREAWKLDWNECALRSARIVPAMKEGQAVGLKLFGLRPGTLFAAAGFQNGDTLLAVNELPLSSPNEALDAVKQLREAEHLAFRISRRGEEVTLKLDVEPAK